MDFTTVVKELTTKVGSSNVHVENLVFIQPLLYDADMFT